MAVFEKNGNWWIDTYVKGKRVRRKIGPDKETAELVIKDLELKAARGEYLGIVEERKIRFEDFVKEYLAWTKGKHAPSTQRNNALTAEKQLIPAFRGKHLASITARDVEKYMTLRVRSVKPPSVNREIGFLRSMLSRAVEWGYLSRNPTKGVKELKFQKRPPTFLTLEQLDKLLSVCDQEEMFVYIVLGAYTGMRKSEILRLTWEDVDFSRHEITVRERKNKEFGVIPMNELVEETLRKHPKQIVNGKDGPIPCPFVLSGIDGTLHQHLNYQLDVLLKKAELPRVRVHDLRHYADSRIMPTRLIA